MPRVTLPGCSPDPAAELGVQPDPDFDRALARDPELREVRHALEQKLGVGGGMALAIVQMIWCKGRDHALRASAAEHALEKRADV